MPENSKVYYSHYIFDNNSTFCRECFSEIESREEDQRHVKGYRVPPRKTKRVRVGKLFVPQARGITVRYGVDLNTGEAVRSVAVCWKKDQFSKSLGRSIANLSAKGMRNVKVTVGNPKEITKRELEAIFADIEPILIW